MLAWNPHAPAQPAARARAPRHRRRPRLLRAEARPRPAHRPPALRRPVPRHLALQRAHHRQRGAVGRRAGADRARPDLRLARRGEPGHAPAACPTWPCADEDAYVAWRSAWPTSLSTLAGLQRLPGRPPHGRCRCSTPSAWRATWTHCLTHARRRHLAGLALQALPARPATRTPARTPGPSDASRSPPWSSAPRPDFGDAAAPRRPGA